MKAGWLREWPEEVELGLPLQEIDHDPNAEAPTPLTDEEQASLKDALGTRFSQLRNWFYNEYAKVRRRRGGVAQSTISLAALLFKARPKSRRRHQVLELYQKIHEVKVRAALRNSEYDSLNEAAQCRDEDQEWIDDEDDEVKIKRISDARRRRMKVRRRVVQELWDAEDEEVHKTIRGMVKAEVVSRMEMIMRGRCVDAEEMRVCRWMVYIPRAGAKNEASVLNGSERTIQGARGVECRLKAEGGVCPRQPCCVSGSTVRKGITSGTGGGRAVNGMVRTIQRACGVECGVKMEGGVCPRQPCCVSGSGVRKGGASGGGRSARGKWSGAQDPVGVQGRMRCQKEGRGVPKTALLRLRIWGAQGWRERGRAERTRIQWACKVECGVKRKGGVCPRQPCCVSGSGVRKGGASGGGRSARGKWSGVQDPVGVQGRMRCQKEGRGVPKTALLRLRIWGAQGRRERGGWSAHGKWPGAQDPAGVRGRMRCQKEGRGVPRTALLRLRIWGAQGRRERGGWCAHGKRPGAQDPAGVRGRMRRQNGGRGAPKVALLRLRFWGAQGRRERVARARKGVGRADLEGGEPAGIAREEVQLWWGKQEVSIITCTNNPPSPKCGNLTSSVGDTPLRKDATRPHTTTPQYMLDNPERSRRREHAKQRREHCHPPGNRLHRGDNAAAAEEQPNWERLPPMCGPGMETLLAWAQKVIEEGKKGKDERRMWGERKKDV
ncbi:hypothetical protein DFH09DRAFT_1106605 [Mycena vulgaris]|nr:hypothetical protein DFH09DRAFT_1106605 [Mycena vulgaris]